MSFVITLLLALDTMCGGQVDRVLERLGLGHRLSESQIVAGLKEALQVGTANTVKQTGRVDGYFKNEAIKILLPEKLRKMEPALRVAGYGQQVDELVLSMNRAAERAAPRAKQIFWDAIKQMTFDDARTILTGPDTAATNYFRQKTTPHLISAFTPIVQQAMNDVGVARRYKEVVGRYQNIPFVKTEPFDLDQYVVEKSLDGLFYVLGEEERKIRRDPAARVTKLLRDVFSS